MLATQHNEPQAKLRKHGLLLTPGQADGGWELTAKGIQYCIKEFGGDAI